MRLSPVHGDAFVIFAQHIILSPVLFRFDLQTDVGKDSRRRCLRNRREGAGGWHRWKKRDFDRCHKDAERFAPHLHARISPSEYDVLS